MMGYVCLFRFQCSPVSHCVKHSGRAYGYAKSASTAALFGIIMPGRNI